MASLRLISKLSPMVSCNVIQEKYMNLCRQQLHVSDCKSPGKIKGAALGVWTKIQVKVCLNRLTCCKIRSQSFPWLASTSGLASIHFLDCGMGLDDCWSDQSSANPETFERRHATQGHIRLAIVKGIIKLELGAIQCHSLYYKYERTNERTNERTGNKTVLV
jgi:hypothetical protein